MRAPDEMIKGFLECALWSSSDDEGSLDERFGLQDFSTESRAYAERVCADFYTKVRNSETAMAARYNVDGDGPEGEQAGWDLWLTYVGHGAGFWDGDWEEGETLSELAGRADVSAYAAADGKIYIS